MLTRHILVVEDCDEDFDTVLDAARLAGLPHPIARARTGDEGLRLMRAASRGREALPLMVLLDLNTPNDDGREALRSIRNDDALHRLPLVVLSASANPRDLLFCYAGCANAYHVEPVDHAKHLQVLQLIFSYWLGSVVLSN